MSPKGEIPMEWRSLLSRKRVSLDGSLHDPSPEAGRSAFERDWDRVLFSTAFRRMHDKTQVFPLPDDDVVHSRLTHSLEVASVGRSLGKRVGREICQRYKIDPDAEFDPHDVGDVVAAACLAHDIGNPPFGHAGEDAIAAFFRSDAGASSLAGLAARERADLEAFEGNAQGFRLITRLQLEVDQGVHLTAATLAAFCKYPRESGDDLKVKGRASTKKHGAFQDDLQALAAVAKESGLPVAIGQSGTNSWTRHPLAFLVEAADDICYSILDIEDGVRLRHVDAKEAEDLLVAVASKAPAFAADRLKVFHEPRLRVGYLRAMAIGQMIEESADKFLEVEATILRGGQDVALGDIIASRDELEALKKLARKQCYKAAEVIEIELAGYEALGGLLGHFIPAVVPDPAASAGTPERQQKALELLRQRSVRVDEESRYRRILRVTDYVSGMTDRHALATYRRLKGIAIPGRIG
jgi:dGTPase